MATESQWDEHVAFGWTACAPDERTGQNPYAPLQGSVERLRGLPSALVITAENRLDDAPRPRLLRPLLLGAQHFEATSGVFCYAALMEATSTKPRWEKLEIGCATAAVGLY